MTTPSSVPAGRFEIVRSIIHQCPALKLPQSFVERLGGVAQIVALKGATNEFAEHVADCLNASVPAQGEAMDDLRRAIAFLDQVRAAPAEETSGTGALRDAREWIESAARALVAASPCAAEPSTFDLQAIADAPSRLPCAFCDGRGFYGIPGQRCQLCDGKGTVPLGPEATSAAAQGGQQPVAFPNRLQVEREIARTENPPSGALNFNDSKERVTLPGGTLRRMLALIDRSAAPAPAAPLTDTRLVELANAHGITYVGGLRALHRTVIAFGRAIEAAHGITLAGTAGTKKESE